MPATIPYDPSLVLGIVVAPEELSVLKEIGHTHAQADAERENLNSLLRHRHALATTRDELLELSADTQIVDDEIVVVDAAIRASVDALRKLGP